MDLLSGAAQSDAFQRTTAPTSRSGCRSGTCAATWKLRGRIRSSRPPKLAEVAERADLWPLVQRALQDDRLLLLVDGVDEWRESRGRTCPRDLGGIPRSYQRLSEPLHTPVRGRPAELAAPVGPGGDHAADRRSAPHHRGGVLLPMTHPEAVRPAGRREAGVERFWTSSRPPQNSPGSPGPLCS